MIQAKIATEDLLLSFTKMCETLIKQTHTRPQGTLEFKLTKSKVSFSFKPPILFDGSWTLGLIILELYNSVCNITEQNNKFQLHTDIFDELSFEELKDELEEILNT